MGDDILMDIGVPRSEIAYIVANGRRADGNPLWTNASPRRSSSMTSKRLPEL